MHRRGKGGLDRVGTHQRCAVAAIFLRCAAHNAEFPAVDVACGEHSQRAVAVLRGDDGNHAHASVEGLFHLLYRHVAHLRDGAEDRCRGPRGAVHLCDLALWNDALHVAHRPPPVTWQKVRTSHSLARARQSSA